MNKKHLLALITGFGLIATPITYASENSDLLDACMERMLIGDKTAYTDCYTEDFLLTIPETKTLSKSGSLRGKVAVEALADMFKTDGEVMDRETRVGTQLEGDNVIMREVIYLMKANPDKPGYVPEQEYEPGYTSAGRHLSLFRFKDGKISEEFTQWDMLGFFLDLNLGDFKKTGQMVSGMGKMAEEMKAKMNIKDEE